MSEVICMVCNELNTGDVQTVRVSDDREKFDLIGHVKCTDDVYKKIKNVKDIEKKNVSKVLKEIGIKR